MLEFRIGKVEMRDVNVFVIVETQDGKRIGTLHLPEIRDWKLKQQIAESKAIVFLTESERLELDSAIDHKMFFSKEVK